MRCSHCGSNPTSPGSTSTPKSAMHRSSRTAEPDGVAGVHVSACEDGAVNDAVSAALFARAQAVTPGGVNSPVRAFGAVGGTPRFMVRSEGPQLFDADGNSYVDLVCSWGPTILGHAHPAVVDAVQA